MPLTPVSLTLNKEPIPTREVSELRAVRAEPPARKGAKAAATITVLVNGERVRVPALSPARVTDLIPGAERPTIARLQDQGWAFVERDSLPDSPDVPAGRVLVRDDGQVSLGTNRLTVKFKDPEADPAVQLKAFGPKVVTPLKFDKGLYTVLLQPADGRDALDVAAELTAGGTVEYAEPELVEVISGR